MNEVAFLSGLLGVGVALVLIRLSSFERRLDRLARLDAKVDALLKASGAGRWHSGLTEKLAESSK